MENTPVANYKEFKELADQAHGKRIELGECFSFPITGSTTKPAYYTGQGKGTKIRAGRGSQGIIHRVKNTICPRIGIFANGKVWLTIE